ncbi:hypothetical protein SAMN04487989_1047 [Bizionia echini]|uniref:Uncharacterized protein n=1 Tax=Bizionia echini TaxID=649333 RepID=A0A1I5BVQ5_9FLAO|nr:DUF6095 family protein [Bizionia echini]SFN78768.1 hypothetical protein SAMN04487989_1047 [Bizionia echini]
METETKRTDKGVLLKGIKKMGVSLLCMFLGPTLLYIAFSNQEKALYIPLLIVGIIICGLALFFAFKGLKTIMDSMFN